ncbi:MULTISPECIES: outer membrane protein assembly factor BamD [Halomonas]|uniref:Outer membrane protein assembly factor BamD n=2 Tax=Halomonas TaxID=2745 RepID=A0A7X5AL91_9GAMM|nr:MULTISPECIES: outer membrane protein assembly factor BamD [Halomonas]MDR5903173.1 outer membrane protein assembly factor BamD [Halomonas icarae]NAW13157.1 outer membrane protein assembly factor BamD [Halomonas icarae]TDA95821.1 outer membrane protein assembly factor BamD [Halomonas marinisediminis]
MRVSNTPVRFAALLLATSLLTGCSLFGGGSDASSDEAASSTQASPSQRAAEEEVEYANLGERELYEEARDSLDRGNFTAAISRLEALDTRFPFGGHAEQAQLELIYAYYETGNWEATRAAANRFIRLHPSHPQADYALYMRGLAAWQAGRFSLERLKLIDISKRDLGASRDAYSDFRELARLYPNSQYAPDARQRIVYLRNLLSRHELHVADYYMRRGAYLAAVERGRWVIEHYPQSEATRDALAVMVEGYLGLEMRDRARETLRVLIDNAPDHEQLRGRTFTPRHVDADSISA